MEALIVLLVVAIPFLALVSVILGIVAMRRLSGLRKRLEQLEGAQNGVSVNISERLRRLEEELRDLRKGIMGEAAVLTPEVGPPTPEERPAADKPTPPAPPSPPAPREEAQPVEVKAPAVHVATTEAAPRAVGRTVDWERWIGVRGAAVVGGGVLALAALLFFRYSIEHDLISPAMRVIIGVAVGLGCVFFSEWLRPRRQHFVANALAGAGAVTLYASVWAARTLYGLVGTVPAFLLMVVITAACGLLALRRKSLLIAVLGLVGGFATPILVASEVDQPVTLFAYLLLLDGGLLWLARRRGWSVLAVLSVAGTGLHQGLWIVGNMGPERTPLGLAVVGVFAVVFVLSGVRPGDALWRLGRTAALVFAFAFALFFAGSSFLGDHLAPVGLLLAMLAGAAVWLAGAQGPRLLALGAAVATVAASALWFAAHPDPVMALVWETVLVGGALVFLFFLAEALSPRKQRGGGWWVPIVAACGLLVILIGVAAGSSSGAPWPWLAGWVGLAALLVFASRAYGARWAQLFGWLGAACGVVLFIANNAEDPGFPGGTVIIGVVLAVALLAQAVALVWRDPVRAGIGNHTSALVAVVLQLGMIGIIEWGGAYSLEELAAASVLGLLAALASTRGGFGWWYLAAVVSTALVHLWWTFDRTPAEISAPYALVVQGAAAVIFTLWPLLVRPASARARPAWYGAALAGPLWFPSLKVLFEARFGDAAIGVLPLALAAVALAGGLLVNRARSTPAPGRASALIWYLAVALSLVSIAVPLQLEKQWVTIGWALNGLAVLLLWRRLDHPGLKFFGLGLLGAATIRLVVNPAVLSYHGPSTMPVLNWLLYTYLVPVAALVGSSRVLASLEAERMRPWEVRLTGGDRSPGAAACGLAAVAVAFVWINLTVADAFADSSALTLSFERMPARDVTTSVAWAGYAVVLLVLGIRRDSTALRWLSLGLLVLTILKVFLHDLGQLEDLYRVASLLGLAVSLIAVSLAYQRFVLRRSPPEEP